MLEQPDARLLWAAHRGGVEARGQRGDGLTTLILVECEENQKLRLGIWFGPDPEPDAPLDEADWDGSVADEREIREFMDHFALCGG